MSYDLVEFSELKKMPHEEKVKHSKQLSDVLTQEWDETIAHVQRQYDRYKDCLTKPVDSEEHRYIALVQHGAILASMRKALRNSVLEVAQLLASIEHNAG